MAVLHPQLVRRLRRAVRARRAAGPAHPGRAGDPGRRGLPAAGVAGPGVRGARRQRRRRDAHPAGRRRGRGGRPRRRGRLDPLPHHVLLPRAAGPAQHRRAAGAGAVPARDRHGRGPDRGAGRVSEPRRQPTAKKPTAKKPTAKKPTAKKPTAKGRDQKSIAARASEQRAARRRERSGGGTAGARPPPRRRSPTGDAPAAVQAPNGVRLQRVLASAGLGSRRACEQLIDEGRVEVDGAVVVDQGLRVDPRTAVIHVNGLRIASAPDNVYLMLNKPTGVLSTMHDPEGRLTVADFLGMREARLFHVGRLDADTEGLILFTNDGDLAHRLSHPSFGVVKTYLAEITGPVGRDVGRTLKAGVELEDGPAKVDGFRLVDTVGTRVLVEISLHEGRKHIVRRMLAEVGHPVSRLVRTDLGPLTLGNLKPGKQRKLSQQEIGALYRAVGL